VNVYERSGADDGATNWSGSQHGSSYAPQELSNYQTAAGFDHPDGDDTETVTDGAGNFFAVWAEGESRAGSGDVYFAMF
jgi:hypothetical protein